MGDVVLVHRLPRADELCALRRAVGWHVADVSDVEAALPNSLYGVCVELDGRCVGCGRVVGDGALVFYVQDVIVHPEHQRKGYGTIIMDAIMEYIDVTARPTAVIGLCAASGMERWYSRYGFRARPNERQGAGMTWHKR